MVSSKVTVVIRLASFCSASSITSPEDPAPPHTHTHKEKEKEGEKRRGKFKGSGIGGKTLMVTYRDPCVQNYWSDFALQSYM